MGTWLGPTGTTVQPNSTSIGVPPANFQQQAAATTAGQKSAGWFADLWAYLFAGWPSGLSVVWATFISGFQDLIALVVKFYGLFQGQNTPGFYTLTGAVLSDLIGVELDIGTVGYGQGGAANRAGNQRIGQSFYGVLTSLLAAPLPLSPAGGLAAAEGFLGFLISFAIRQGNIEFISELIPEEFRIGEGVKAYGENLSRALGLGRMARLAFTPLINTLIADPLKWYLNSQYRPTLLNEGQLIRSALRGIETTPDLPTSLSWLGHSDANITALQEESITQLSTADVYRFWAKGQLDTSTAIQRIVRTGTTADIASLMLEAMDLGAGDTAVSEQVTYLTNARLSGQLDSATYQSLISGLPISPTRVAALVSYTSQRLELPVKTLTLAEMQTAYLHGLTDLTTLEQFIVNQGYSQGTGGDPTNYAQLYVMLTLEKLDTHDAQVAVAQYKYDKAVATAKAKNEPIPPKPAILATS